MNHEQQQRNLSKWQTTDHTKDTNTKPLLLQLHKQFCYVISLISCFVPVTPIGPTSPFSPFSPGVPSFPLFPLSPFSPRCPLLPGIPGCPGTPGGPSFPLGPGSPFKPLGPAGPCRPLGPVPPLSPNEEQFSQQMNQKLCLALLCQNVQPRKCGNKVALSFKIIPFCNSAASWTIPVVNADVS